MGADQSVTVIITPSFHAVHISDAQQQQQFHLASSRSLQRRFSIRTSPTIFGWAYKHATERAFPINPPPKRPNFGSQSRTPPRRPPQLEPTELPGYSLYFLRQAEVQCRRLLGRPPLPLARIQCCPHLTRPRLAQPPQHTASAMRHDRPHDFCTLVLLATIDADTQLYIRVASTTATGLFPCHQAFGHGGNTDIKFFLAKYGIFIIRGMAFNGRLWNSARRTLYLITLLFHSASGTCPEY